MSKKIITLSFVFLTLLACQIVKSDVISKGEVYTEGNITWKYGIAFIDGKAKYINPENLDQSVMLISVSMIEKFKKENKKIIPAGKLIWDITSGSQVLVYDTKVEKPYYQIIKSEKLYYLKIQNNTTYVSENRQEWYELFIEVIQDKPQYYKSNDEPPVYMIIRLKCKYFEGEYEIIGTTG